jgi:hypothetical protein
VSLCGKSILARHSFRLLEQPRLIRWPASCFCRRANRFGNDFPRKGDAYAPNAVSPPRTPRCSNSGSDDGWPNQAGTDGSRISMGRNDFHGSDGRDCGFQFGPRGALPRASWSRQRPRLIIEKSLLLDVLVCRGPDWPSVTFLSSTPTTCVASVKDPLPDGLPPWPTSQHPALL